jgi:hypothetical protein
MKKEKVKRTFGGTVGSRERARAFQHRRARAWTGVCVYYCSTYCKAVRGGGGETIEDMCYERLRAEACAD